MATPPAGAAIDCECLVVGSGAGGAVTAAGLARRGRDVLIVEEGPDPAEAVREPSIAATMPVLWRDGGIIPILSNAKFVFGEGRCLGGSTVVNAGLVHRTPAEAIERWRRDFRVAALDAASLQPYHEAVERSLRVREPPEDAGPAGRYLEEGARRCGFSGHRTRVAADLVDGRLRKNDARRTFIAEAAGLGARILTGCAVRRIRFSAGNAEEVEVVLRDGAGRPRPATIRCRRLYVCAGAIQTPLLLRRSGVTSAVGDGIGFHPMLRVVAEYAAPVDGHAYPMPSFQIDQFAPRIKLGASVMAPSYAAAALTTNWAEGRRHLGALRSMATYYVSVASGARGKVRNLPLLSSYAVRYRIDDEALRDVGLGLEKLAEVLFAAGAVRLYPAIEGVAPWTDLGACRGVTAAPLPAGRLNFTAVHAFSSCPMGEDETRCPVDSFGKVRGLRNVWVADASILPTAPGVNPQGPVMAMAMRNLESSAP